MSTGVNETPKRKSRTKRFLTWLFALLLVLLIADQVARVWSFNQVLAATEASEGVINDFKAELFLASDRVDSGIEAADADIAQSAEIVVASLNTADIQLSKIPILPWHTAIKQALVDYRAHNRAWVEAAEFAEIVGDGEVIRQSDVFLINETWEATLASLNGARPLFEVLDFSRRIIEIDRAEV